MRNSMIALAAAASVALAAGSATAQSVSIGTLPQGSLAYGIASSVAKVISDNSDLITRAVGIGGSNIFIPQVNMGKLEMSTANAVEANFAVRGTGTFPGKPNPNLLILTRLLTFQTGFMVRKDSSIQSLADLKGQKVPSGFTSHQVPLSLTSRTDVAGARSAGGLARMTGGTGAAPNGANTSSKLKFEYSARPLVLVLRPNANPMESAPG